MTIVSQDMETVYEWGEKSCFYTIWRPDISILYVSRGSGDAGVSMGTYTGVKESNEVLLEFANAIRNGDKVFYMPLSEAVAREARVKDARKKRRMGSEP